MCNCRSGSFGKELSTDAKIKKARQVSLPGRIRSSLEGDTLL